MGIYVYICINMCEYMYICVYIEQLQHGTIDRTMEQLQHGTLNLGTLNPASWNSCTLDLDRDLRCDLKRDLTGKSRL